MSVNWVINPCRRFQEPLALLAAGLCDELEKLLVEKHLESCASCRNELQALAGVTARMAGLKAEGATVRPSEGLYARWSEQILGRRGESGRRIAVQFRWPAWGLGFAVSLLVVLGLDYWHGRAAGKDPLENASVVRETLAMFPNQVRAIEQDDRGMNLILSDGKNVPPSAVLYIRVTDGRRTSSFLTFSGQEIMIAGQAVTVLADTHGGVILAGDHFLWSAKERVDGGHLKIQAKNLGLMVM